MKILITVLRKKLAISLLLFIFLGACDQCNDAATHLLVDASINGDLANVVRLVEDGSNPNCQSGKEGPTPLTAAASGGHVEIIRHLLAHKAKINQRAAPGTPLTVAALAGQASVVELLLSAGGKLELDQGGAQHLRRVLRESKQFAIEMLIDEQLKLSEQKK